MKRQGIVAVVAIVALVIAVVFLARRGSVGGEKEAGGEATGSRFYASDSLGFRLRIPDSPDWTLRTEPAGQPDGSILTAMHSNEMAIVRVFTHPAAPGETVDDVFEARKRVFAKFFGIDDLDSAIAKVMQEGHHELEGRHSRQWQAITQPTASPEGEPLAIVFMWLITLDPNRAVECIGLVRTPLPPSPEQQQVTDGLLKDVAYILQSFEVR